MAQNSMHDLADRVRHGDLTAAAEMRQVLEPNLARMARRAMRHDTRSILRVTQSIRDRADSLAPDRHRPQDGGREKLAEQVVESLTASVLGSLQSAPPLELRLQETVRD